MKKFLAFLLAMTMLLGLCACGSDDTAKKDDNKAGATTAATEAGTTAGTSADDGDTTTTTIPAETEGTTAGSETEATEGTTAGTEAPTTGATKEPTKATTPTTQPTQPKPDEPADDRPTIKILSIGHSFSRDAMDTYMADLFKAAGYNATFGYLYYPGASLERQYHYIKDNSTSYEMYNKCVDGVWYKSQGGANAEQALMDEDWDIVTFQPSPDYGKGTMEYDCQWGCKRKVNDYEHFDQLVKLVKDKLAAFGNEDVKFYWHLTWAFASDCKLWSFTYSNYSQTTMYWDFIKATGTYINTNPNIVGTIPCNTSIQNVRTSWMGDTFNEPGEYNPNKDGYHLNDKGDLVAAMTWVAYFTGKSATEFKISTQYSDRQYAAFAEAVDAAIKAPLKITKSTYTTES